MPPPSDCVQSDPAFSPILFGRSFDGTRDKWTAMGQRLAWAGCPLAASPLKCNMLFVTELWPKSSAIESIRPSRRASEEEGRFLRVFCGLDSQSGRQRASGQRERETNEGGGGAQKVAPYIHFLPPPTIDFESAAFVLGEARRRS